jgi:hypothetical protein
VAGKSCKEVRENECREYYTKERKRTRVVCELAWTLVVRGNGETKRQFKFVRSTIQVHEGSY